MNIDRMQYMKLVNDRNLLIKENKRLKSALAVRGVFWKNSKQYTETNGKGNPITDVVVYDG